MAGGPIYVGGVPFFKPGLRFPGAVFIPILGLVAPVNGTTGANVAGVGSIYIDRILGNFYINTGSKASPTWTQLVSSGSIGAATGTSLAVTGAITSSGGKIGYATGAGGAVVQATDKSTGVTLSKLSGQITMNAASLAAGAEASFVVTNTLIAAGDVVLLNHASAGTAGAYDVVANAIVAATSFSVTVSNLSAGALAEAIVLNFVIIKGVSA